jgi:hypothetical protein
MSRVLDDDDELTQAEWDAIELALYGTVAITQTVSQWARLECVILEIVQTRLDRTPPIARRWSATR